MDLHKSLKTESWMSPTNNFGGARPRSAVFRTSASPEIGGGHVTRCLALADMLSAQGWQCTFASGEKTLPTMPALADSAHKISRVLDETAAPSKRDGAWSPEECDLLVFDHYALDAAYESACRPWAKRIVVLDDLANRPHDCDVLLDQTLGRRPEDYESLVPSQCNLLLGTKFTLLRSAFAGARKRAATERDGQLRNVLIAPGQTDQAGLTTLAVTAIQQALPDAEINIVVGVRNPQFATFDQPGADNVHVHVGASAEAVAELITNADIAIGAAGSSAWERCALGLPAALVIIADNQSEVAATLEEAGAAKVVGRVENLDVDTLATAIENLAANPDLLVHMSQKASEICDGRGTFRTMVALTPDLPAVDGSTIRLRAAELVDAALMYDWQIHRDTRKYARCESMPPFREHMSWLRQRLTNAGCLFTIIERDGAPAGILRLDACSDGYEISIVVAPNRRNQSIGAAALQLGRALVPGKKLSAYVKRENTASVRLFESAGYRLGSDGMYSHLPSAA
ncbi:MAG: UDP-2,4-diacetamido-2,4,6-trideoxy-beta-L-altropyranose hydrolase [Alphaproteobacteria bacterium]|nr:UDP-2,4-diacetamido-2,4,6-trideoxy-beta-L-altropyranose hydrolase [Alphaproteobacteria bacterium]